MGEIFTPRIHAKKSIGSNTTEYYEQDHFNAPTHIKRDVKVTTKSISAIKDDDWKSLVNSITYLFHNKQLQKLELDVLNEKVRNVRGSKKGAFIVECYKDSILKKGQDFIISCTLCQIYTSKFQFKCFLFTKLVVKDLYMLCCKESFPDYMRLAVLFYLYCKSKKLCQGTCDRIHVL